MILAGYRLADHGYTEYAEGAFKTLFERIFEKVKDNSFDIEPYEPKSAEGEAVKIVERLRHADRYTR
jgi:hypothetical protein